MHHRLLAAALPGEEKRIRTSYLPALVLVVAASTVVFVALVHIRFLVQLRGLQNNYIIL